VEAEQKSENPQKTNEIPAKILGKGLQGSHFYATGNRSAILI
jgi:hypothetical protein